MPLYPSQNLVSKSRLLIWKLEETVDELYARLPRYADLAELETISHPQKRREWMTSRILLQYLATAEGIIYQGTFKDSHGKPFLAGSDAHISITNTAGYVAAVLHPSQPTGIDMEFVSDKLGRASSKFLSEPEQQHAGNDLHKLAAYWCAKEALFKMNGRKSVSFKNCITIQPFESGAERIWGSLIDGTERIDTSIRIIGIDGYCLAVAD